MNNNDDDISDEFKQELADIRRRVSVGLQTWNRGVIDMCKGAGLDQRVATVLISTELSLCLAFYLALMPQEAAERSMELVQAAANRIRDEAQSPVQ